MRRAIARERVWGFLLSSRRAKGSSRVVSRPFSTSKIVHWRAARAAHRPWIYNSDVRRLRFALRSAREESSPACCSFLLFIKIPSNW